MMYFCFVKWKIYLTNGKRNKKYTFNNVFVKENVFCSTGVTMFLWTSCFQSKTLKFVYE